VETIESDVIDGSLQEAEKAMVGTMIESDGWKRVIWYWKVAHRKAPRWRLKAKVESA